MTKANTDKSLRSTGTALRRALSLARDDRARHLAVVDAVGTAFRSLTGAFGVSMAANDMATVRAILGQIGWVELMRLQVSATPLPATVAWAACSLILLADLEIGLANAIDVAVAVPTLPMDLESMELRWMATSLADVPLPQEPNSGELQALLGSASAAKSDAIWECALRTQRRPPVKFSPLKHVPYSDVPLFLCLTDMVLRRRGLAGGPYFEWSTWSQFLDCKPRPLLSVDAVVSEIREVAGGLKGHIASLRAKRANGATELLSTAAQRRAEVGVARLADVFGSEQGDRALRKKR